MVTERIDYFITNNLSIILAKIKMVTELLGKSQYKVFCIILAKIKMVTELALATLCAT